jgi:Flp pilus assembly pilin Flp
MTRIKPLARLLDGVRSDVQGIAFIEYALMGLLIGVAMVGAIEALGGHLVTLYNSFGAAL